MENLPSMTFIVWWPEITLGTLLPRFKKMFVQWITYSKVIFRQKTGKKTLQNWSDPTFPQLTINAKCGFRKILFIPPPPKGISFIASENQAVYVFISAVEQQMSWNQMDGKHL